MTAPKPLSNHEIVTIGVFLLGGDASKFWFESGPALQMEL